MKRKYQNQRKLNQKTQLIVSLKDGFPEESTSTQSHEEQAEIQQAKKCRKRFKSEEQRPWKNIQMQSVFRKQIHFQKLFFFFFCFLEPYLQHMEVPRLGVHSELQLLAYATATAMPDLSQVFDLHHSSQQRQILIHGARLGMEPESLWILVGFVSAVPQWKLLLFKNF